MNPARAGHSSANVPIVALVHPQCGAELGQLSQNVAELIASPLASLYIYLYYYTCVYVHTCAPMYLNLIDIV